MRANAVITKAGIVTIRPLRPGDTATVQAVFHRLGPESRRRRFGNAKSTLTPAELAELARVDGRRHVLVAYAAREPIGIARLARDDDEADVAEIAYAVADAWQRLGVGTALVRQLSADARAAGIARLHATIGVENRPSLALLRRATTIVSSRIVDGELHVVSFAAA